MPGKPLDPDADALWQRVADTVRPLKGRRLKKAPTLPAVSVEKPAPLRPPTPKPIAKATTPGDTLDGGWDRRLRRGVVGPDLTIDLHGYTLLAAHDVLEAELGRAIQRHARLVLLVTGRPPRDSTERIDGRPVRGAIRASIGDWLHHSRHSSHIAAVRSAHPRHGGAGALYVILRRTRG